MMKKIASRCHHLMFLWAVSFPIFALELEPRRWLHIPIDTNFLGVGYAHTEGDINIDPILRAENVEVDLDATAMKYIRSFDFLDKTAQISLAQAHINATWTGLLDGVLTEVQRVGLSDTILRFAIILKGAPPLKGKAYRAYRAGQKTETIIGAGLSIQLPTGEYKEDKLINLGTNHFTFRPQLGVVHTRGNWSVELTGAVWLHSDNDDFFGGNELEQDHLVFLQGHLNRRLKSGKWIGLGLGYAEGGESTINGIDKDNKRQDLVWALSYGFTITPRLGAKLVYVGNKTNQSTGLDSDSLVFSLSTFW